MANLITVNLISSGVHRIPVYQVDAFTGRRFRGNPAGVCILKRQLSDRVLQLIARELGHPETAFLLPLEKGPLHRLNRFSLRWFTPAMEVDLCGHATLATAKVLFEDVGVLRNELEFETRSGVLKAKSRRGMIMLDFPLRRVEPFDPPEEILSSLGIRDPLRVTFCSEAYALLIHVKDEETVRKMNPDFERLKRAKSGNDIYGVIVTARSTGKYDFVSRYFAPWSGVNEDPVTGSAHTILGPYWSEILGKNRMVAYQASERGGEIRVSVRDSEGRVDLAGKGVLVMKGVLMV